LAAGVTFTVRFAPEPPKVMLEFGTSVVLDELPLTVRLPAGVPASPTVKARSPVAVSSFFVWSAMGEMVGGTLLTVTVKLAGA
jgi:hypothetical protein